MRRLLALLLVAALMATGCGANPGDGVLRVVSVTTDGDSVYAVVNKALPGSLVVKFDADGDTVWERQIGPSDDGGYLHDGYLWVVEDEPLGEDPTLEEPDSLLKLDPETGEILGSVTIGAATDDPTVVIDGQLWLVSNANSTFEILDLDTLEIVDTLDIDIGPFLDSSRADDGGALSPFAIGDYIYLLADRRNVIVKYSIDRREIENVLAANDLIIRFPLEVHDGELWAPGSPSRVEDEWFAYRVDLERFEVAEAMPFLESPMWSLTTDDYIFDQIAANRFEETAEIAQIDRDTGEVIRTIDGRRPQFVLDDHLWLANLERVKLD